MLHVIAKACRKGRRNRLQASNKQNNNKIAKQQIKTKQHTNENPERKQSDLLALDDFFTESPEDAEAFFQSEGLLVFHEVCAQFVGQLSHRGHLTLRLFQLSLRSLHIHLYFTLTQTTSLQTLCLLPYADRLI